MDLSISATESADSEKFRFEEQYSLAQVFKPEDDGRDKIVISVIDSGIGMSKSDKAKLFKLFGALQNVDQNNSQGIGIGLTICERLVKAY
jgi:signal transduction histidine kinase